MKKVMVMIGVMSALILNTAVSADTNKTLKQLNLPNLPAQATGDYLLNYDSGTEVFFWAAIQYSIGEIGPQGGHVFYTSAGGSHGLEAAPVDQGSVEWGCNKTDISGADGTEIGTGRQNTTDILAGCFEDGIAAEVASSYVWPGGRAWPKGQADGFLPSKDELNLMWKNLADSDGDGLNTGPLDPSNLGGFTNDYYWSSSEYDSFTAWYQYFGYGLQSSINKINAYFRVRAVRAF